MTVLATKDSYVRPEGLTDLLQRAASAVRANGSMNEAQTRRIIVEPALRLLGWDLDGPVEVQAEFPVIRDRVDYALMISERPALLVETKRVRSNLSDLSSIAQTVNYGNTLNVPWAVLTNGHEWSLYCVHARLPMPDKLFRHIDLLKATVAEAASFMSLITRESVASDALSAVWAAEQVGRVGLKDGEIRHSTLNDERFRDVVLSVERILGTALFNEGGPMTFVSSHGETIQFSKSSPYKGTDTRFVKIRPDHLKGAWFVVWCPDKPDGWMIPTPPLRSFLGGIPLSKRSRGGPSWDPRIGSRDGVDSLWTDLAKHGFLNAQRYRVGLA